MGFQLSPGVEIKEFDFSNIIPAVATTSGGYAGRFIWGPADDVYTISSENELKSVYGKPTDAIASGWFTAANFLSYGNNLKVVRVISDACFNANSNLVGNTADAGLVIRNDAEFTTKYDAGTVDFAFAAKYPGKLGNSIAVYHYNAPADHTLETTQFFLDWGATYKEVFNRAPNSAEGLGTGQLTGGSTWAHERSKYLDEVNIVVVDATGEISGIAGTILERFEGLSVFPGAKKADGSANYVPTVINDQSAYIWVGSAYDVPGGTVGIYEYELTSTPVNESVITATEGALGKFTFTEGADGTDVDFGIGDYWNADGTRGYGRFLDSEQIDVSLVMLGAPDGAGSAVIHTTLAQNLVELCETRKDCVAFISAPYTGVFNETTGTAILANSIAWRQGTGSFAGTGFNRSSSYAVLDSGWKKQYDPYNDTFRWVPLNGDMAGLCAKTDADRDPWYSPAGLNRGQVKRVVKLAFNPNQTQRDELYQVGINPVVTFPGQGVVLYGDKTALAKPSAFDRINVRRLFIVLEKAIATSAKFQLFEFNDVFTRQAFVALVEPYLREIKGRRGLYDFKVVCDESNNTPEVIDGNRFVASILLKPTKSINFITLNFVATRTGVDFTEVSGGF